MLFKIKDKQGSHWEGDKEYTAGQLVPSKRDLAAIWPDRFVRVADPVDVPTPAPAPAPVVDPDDDEDIPEDKKKLKEGDKPEDHGFKDVSADFPGAAEKNLLVWQKGKKYNVTRAGDPEYRMVNKVPLAKVEVEDCIIDYKAGE